MSKTITVLLSNGPDQNWERSWTDDENTRWDYVIVDGVLHIKEVRRLIAFRSQGLKQARPVAAYAPGVWTEVCVDYGS